MRKSKSMRMASGLLVVTMLSTCMISGTFARYTTQDNASDTARVAKWGVELQVDGSLFEPGYLEATNTATENTTGVSVLHSSGSANADFVVAPGTKSDKGFHFSLNGTPEVATLTNATIKAQNVFLKGETGRTYGLMVPTNVVTKENFSAGTYYKLDAGTYTKVDTYDDSVTTYYTLEDEASVSANYYPVVYKLAGTTELDSGADTADSLNEIAQKIADTMQTSTVTATTDGNQISTYKVSNVKVDPNENLATELSMSTETITWEWAYDHSDSGEGDSACDKCKADTILGLLMDDNTKNQVVMSGNSGATYVAPVEYTDYCLNTQFSIDITVTQVE